MRHLFIVLTALFGFVLSALMAIAPSPKDELLTAEEVADWLGVHVQTFYRWRYGPNPDAPPAVRVGGHKLKWRRSTVEKWLAEREAQDAAQHARATA